MFVDLTPSLPPARIPAQPVLQDETRTGAGLALPTSPQLHILPLSLKVTLLVW